MKKCFVKIVHWSMKISGHPKFLDYSWSNKLVEKIWSKIFCIANNNNNINSNNNKT